MHAGKHRIGWCPSRQPLRTRRLCKYIRWVHVQRSDTKEAHSCCNPALWRWLCSLSCLPSLRIEYLNSLVLCTRTKKGGSSHSQGLYNSYSHFLGLEPSYMYCPTCKAYTLGFREESERSGGQKSTPQMGLFGQHKIYTNWTTFDDIWVIYLFIGSYPPLVFNRLWEAYKTAKSEKWPMLCVLTQILD